MLAAALSLALAAGPGPAGGLAPLPVETYALPNGLTVTLAPDRRLPQVVVDTWFGVGSKDEAKGRTGFAHLFEHLMFMGTKRVPGNRFDVLMESGGGANNASTAEDRTNYFSWGPSSLLPTLLWLDADRFASLSASMTQEKVDLQRDVVRNERRQSVENTPYGIAELVVPEAMYPEGHPYHHPVIGSHEDLQAASLDDVKRFFDTWYVPANASLVVAGDFDPAAVKPLLARLFGAIPARPVPERAAPPPARLDGEVRRVVTDRVELPRLDLVWHAPPAYAPGTADLELLAAVLADGPSSRLQRRLVQDLRLAVSVDAWLDPKALGSLFRIEVTGKPGADLERLKRETLAALADLQARGPTAEELRRVKAQAEVQLRRTREELLARADKLNEYRFYLGVPDAFDRDLARHAAVDVASMRDAARTLGDGRLDLRILPAAAGDPAALDARPADLAPSPFVPPAPEAFRLANGVRVLVIRRPGAGLFAGHVLLDGGERAVPAGEAGLSAVLAQLLTAGAAGRSAPEFDDAVRALGATIRARATGAAIDVSVTGMSSRLAPTLELLADAVLRPNLAPADFQREAGIAVARAESRTDRPNEVARAVALGALFGPDDPRGRPVDGWPRTLRAIRLEDVRALAPRLLSPRGATLVFAGDLDVPALRRALEARFGAWAPRGAAVPAEAPARPDAAPRLLLVDRPGAPQTVIFAARPVPVADERARAARAVVNTLLGGAFTSRLNQDLREKHGYTYGARSAFEQDGRQPVFVATTAVQTEVTGAALAELRRELDGLAAGGLGDAEVAKARETARYALVEASGTAERLAGAEARAILAGRPDDALARAGAALPEVDVARADAEARAGTYRYGGLAVVLVGDARAVLPQLEKAGFPAPERVDAEGRPVGAASAAR